MVHDKGAAAAPAPSLWVSLGWLRALRLGFAPSLCPKGSGSAGWAGNTQVGWGTLRLDGKHSSLIGNTQAELRTLRFEGERSGLIGNTQI